MQKINFIIYVVLFCFVLLFFSAYKIQTNRLEHIRQQYTELRIRYEGITDKQQQLTNIFRRTNEVLSNSATTIGEIKQQLRIIKENYQQMENILYNKLDYTDNGNSNDNLFDE